METKFQTSFIPRKNSPQPGGVPSISMPHRHYTGSIFLTLAVLMFVVSIAAIGGAYLWKQYLVGVAEGYKKELTAREAQYQIDTIAKLKADSTRIVLAKQLLSTHLSTSQIFGIISKLTVENVQFVSLSVSTAPNTGGLLKLELDGYGLNLITVAGQSDILGQLDQYGLDKIVRNPIISEPSLNQNGTVSFRLSFTIDPNVLLYDKTLAKQ